MKDWLGFLGRHKGLKALSLILAVALWFAVGGEERTETTLSMALELANVSPNLVVTSEVPAAIQVRILGPQSQVRKLSQGRLTYTLDLSGLKSGRHSFSLSPSSLSFPRDVTVTRIQPSAINLALAAVATRTLPLKPVLEGTPPEGYEIKEVKVRPPQITVKGPSPDLADLKFVPTLPVDVSNLSGSATLPTDVDLKNLHLTPREQVHIVADVTISPKEVTRTLTGVPVVAGPRAAQLSPAQVSVTLQGPLLQLKDLKASDLKASVDLKTPPRRGQRYKVSVTLPPNIRLLRLQPETVTALPAKSS